jgi:hypothetical protein
MSAQSLSAKGVSSMAEFGFRASWHWLRHHHHRRHQHLRAVLQLRHLDCNFAVELSPERETHIMADALVGQTITRTLEIVDNNGNPLSPQPALDSPAQWTQSDSTLETDTISSDGLTDTAVVTAPGTEQTSVSVSVSGQTFTAQVTGNFTAPAPVAAGVRINETVA